MRKIDVRITKGEIKSFVVDMKEDLPTVAATVALFTEEGKEVTTFQISTETYYKINFKLPISMIPPIKELADNLEKIVIAECNKQMEMIEAPK